MPFIIIIGFICVFVYSYRMKKIAEEKKNLGAFNFTTVEEQIEKFGEKLKSDLFLQEENGTVYFNSVGDEK